MKIKKLCVLFMVLSSLCIFTGCVQQPKEPEIQEPEFKEGWYVYKGYTQDIIMYYYQADKITLGGIPEQRYTGQNLIRLNENYSWDKAWENLYDLKGNKLTNAQTGKDEKSEDYSWNLENKKVIWFYYKVSYKTETGGTVGSRLYGEAHGYSINPEKYTIIEEID